MRALRFAVALALALLLVPLEAAAERRAAEPVPVLPPGLSLSVGADYTSGDYGTGSTTEMVYVPVSLRIASEPHAYSLTVPWISVTTQSAGRIVGTDPMGRPIRRGAVRRRATESGLGDALATYERSVFANEASGTYLDGAATVKLATADETRGLGTGRNDYALQLDAYRSAGGANLYATLGYRWNGDPPGEEFANVWFAALGASLRTTERGRLGLVYDYRQAALPSSAAPRELTLYLRADFERDFSLLGYVLRGFADTSPDWGLGATLSVEF